MGMKREKIMDEYRELSIEELDSIAGGFTLEQLSPEDRTHFLELRRRVDYVADEQRNGRATTEQYSAALEEARSFAEYLMAKYDHIY